MPARRAEDKRRPPHRLASLAFSRGATDKEDPTIEAGMAEGDRAYARTRAAGLLVALIASLAMLVASAPASAAVACAFGGASGPGKGLMVVTLDGPGDSATVRRSDLGLLVEGRPCPASTPAIGTASVLNTDTIAVRDRSGGSTEVRLINPGAFAPGPNPESDGSAEIEIDVELGPGPGDVARVEADGPQGRDHFRFGRLGETDAANLNRGVDGGSPDSDMRLGGVELVVADGQGGDDELDGSGGDPFSGPVGSELELFGFGGEDVLRGGTRRDILHGGLGEDLLAGGEARDVLLGQGDEDVLAGGGGADRIDGGGDDDIADFRGAPASKGAGLNADLRSGRTSGAGGGDRLISIEGLIGGSLGDVLSGDGKPNLLAGEAGDDRLFGRGGQDVLLGGPGADRIVGGGARDIAIAGARADMMRGGRGKDIFFAGAGNDRVRTGRGVDIISTAGGGRDLIDCGPGRDGYDADRRDRVRNCEVKLELRN